MKRNQKSCIKCGKLISLSNIDRHESSCQKEQTLSKRVYGPPWNKGLTKDTNSSILSQVITTKERNGYKGYQYKKHSDQAKDRIRESALLSNHRRLVRSIREYTKKDGTFILLDSSWEEALAKRLDDLDIEWIRPTHIYWIDGQGNKRRYFPDFYLPKYNIYLDPKNPYAMKQQHEKVEWLKANIRNLVFLTNEDDIRKYLPMV